jgi:NhaP-type Na+/H+ or K+/H+ antiporter
LAYVVLQFSVSLSLLLGAILIVTGPTVIVPMLKFIRPQANLNHILKWEGILNDPIGAVIAVLSLESILMGSAWAGGLLMFVGIVKTLVVASFIGAVFATLLVTMIRHNWAPERLHNPIVLSMVVGAFALANVVQHESGLLATTVMGIVLANQKQVSISTIVEFKKTLQVLLISMLFILLSARLTWADIEHLGFSSFIYALLLVIVVRPASVWLSSIGSDLNWREKLFIAMMAPRGIVAAAVASVASLLLVEQGYPGAEQLTPLMFLVIAVTIGFYGVFSPLLAKWLDLVKPQDTGVLILGAHDWAREIASHIKASGHRVVLADTHRGNIYKAYTSGLKSTYSSVFSSNLMDDNKLEGIGKLLALTSNDEVNSLGALRFSDMFGQNQTYQLKPADDQYDGQEQDVHHRPLSGQHVFMDGTTFDEFDDRYRHGGSIVILNVVEAFEPSRINYKLHLPLILIRGELVEILTADDGSLSLEPNDTLILLTSDLPLLLRLGYLDFIEDESE